MFEPLNHFDYARLDNECQCKICVTWRTTHATYTQVLSKIEGHARSCRCGECRGKYSARSAYLSALNRRDLYCEGSFHAAAEPKLGKPFMDWLETRVQEGTPGWWEISAPNLPLAHWFRNFGMTIAASAQVSFQATFSLMASGA